MNTNNIFLTDTPRRVKEAAAGIPRKLRVIYTPTLWNPPRLMKLEKGVTYQARLINPGTGEVIPLGAVQADENGQYRFAHFPEQRDWVIVLQR